MLKGHTLIELKDVATGKVKRIEKVNMLTNVLDYILNDNLCGHHNFPSDHPELCFPIVRQLLGGVLLFPKSIEENVETIIPPMAPVGYGGDSTDAGDDARMGTYNLIESGEVTGGYKHVWDFSTSQANGDISCVCLTHRLAGNGWLNNMHQLYYCEGFQSHSYNASEDERDNDYDKATRLFGSSQVVDFDGHRPITVGFDGQSIRVIKWNLVTTGTGVNSQSHDAPPYTKYEELASFTSSTEIDDRGTLAFTNNAYFVKLSDGKYHGYCHGTNTEGDAVIYTMAIDPANWTMEEGKFTVPGKHIYALAQYSSQPNTTGGSYYTATYSAIRGSYLYCIDNALHTIYKINLSDTSRVSEIEVPFRIQGTFIMRHNPVTGFIDIFDSGIQSDGKYRNGIIMKDDTIDVGERDSQYNTSSTYFFADVYGYTPFYENLLGIASYKTWRTGVIDNSEKYAYLGYMASINNISTFVKTPAQTMKITYTITETEETVLASIIITENPKKTTYVAGETLDLDGMKVTAIYSDGVRKDVTAQIKSNPEVGAELNDIDLDEITISYEEDGVTRYATVPVTVFQLVSIAIVKQPTKNAYYSGEQLNLSGIQVMAHYSDGTEEDVTDQCTYVPAEGTELTAATRFVSVTYERGKVQKIETVPISVTQTVLERIEITELPKQAYKPGETLDLKGMKVMAYYNSGTSKDVSDNVTTEPTAGSELSGEGAKTVTVKYSENGVEKSASFDVYVAETINLQKITVVEQPTTQTYKQGNELDVSGIKVEASYNDGHIQDVTSSVKYEPPVGTKLEEPGPQVVKVSYTEQGVTVDTTFTVTVEEKPPYEIVTWADGTDEQIAAMVAALDSGDLTVEETGWNVGDERVVHLSSMEASELGDTHEEQDVVFVLANKGGKQFEGGNDVHFIVVQKDSLKEAGKMNSSSTNAGGWEGCARRTWCNEIYANALPEQLKPIFKKFKNISGVGGGQSSGTQETVDMFALAAEQEIFGTRTNAFADEAEALTQFEYYKDTATHVKKLGKDGSSSSWWERSPNSGNSNYFCRVNSNGTADWGGASGTHGLAPLGCI